AGAGESTGRRRPPAPFFREPGRPLAALPTRKEEGAQLTATQAAHLHEASVALRALLAQSAGPRDGPRRRAAPPPGPDPARLRRLLIDDVRRSKHWARPETVPAL